jgi:hypothetical protein
MSLADKLEAFAKAGEIAAAPDRQRPQHPAGWEPGVVWNGREGAVTSAPMKERPQSWDELLQVWNLDPALYEVVEPVQFRAWDAAIGDGNVQRLHYYRATIRTRRNNGVDVDELVASIGRHKPRKPVPHIGQRVFVYPIGDMQAGKPDGDGTAGTVQRVLDSLDIHVDRYRQLRKQGVTNGTVYLPWLGDCIEGTVSQGGQLAAAGRLDLTLTEQVRVVRRLMLAQVQAFAPYADTIIVPVVPGNHDEAFRAGNVQRRYDDSWAIEAASSVADALALNPDAYGHVSFVFPDKDEWLITLDVAGTVVTFAHGHQWRGEAATAHKWWAGQAHGMQPAGDSTLLLCAHRHHLYVQTAGAKTVLQIPAMDGGSTWWRHSTGQHAPAASLSLTVGGGTWADLHVTAA